MGNQNGAEEQIGEMVSLFCRDQDWIIHDKNYVNATGQSFQLDGATIAPDQVFCCPSSSTKYMTLHFPQGVELNVEIFSKRDLDLSAVGILL